ncbi:MAG: hypothetical protein COB02_09165 [Candidatus Cloacimonadota bacterium]|nr:MAG: hypothetical protein COB02_09165 [Candidatus Cloacimonadota bacterium]
MNKNHLTFVAIGVLALVVSLISTQKIVKEHKIKAQRSSLSIRSKTTSKKLKSKYLMKKKLTNHTQTNIN